MKELFIGLCCGLVGISVQAGDWVSGGSGGNLSQLINFQGMEKNGTKRGVWILNVFEKGSQEDDYSVVWTEFDCKNHKVRMLEFTSYVDGVVREVDNTPESWTRVRPGSIHEGTLKQVCNRTRSTEYKDDDPFEVVKKERQYLEQKGYWKSTKDADRDTSSSKQTKSKEDEFYRLMDKYVPNWESQNTNPDFLRWLEQKDPTYGFVRNDALQDAFNKLDARTVANIFIEFQRTSNKK